MKIYHKKNFKLGLWSLVLAALLLAAGLWRGNFDWKDGVLCALLAFLGGGNLIRSLSRENSREDKVEELDERNRLVKLKAQSQAYHISQFVFLCGASALCALGKWNGSMLWVGAGLGLMAAFLFALAADFITWVYYDEHT